MGLDVIPNDIPNLTTGEKRVANKLKSLYSKVDRDCCLYVQPRLGNLNPDFILIDAFKGVCVIEVKDWSTEYIASIDGRHVTDIYGKQLNNPIFWTNQYFNYTKNIFEKNGLLLGDNNQLKFNICSKVLFTNISSKEIEEWNQYLDDTFNDPLYQPPTEYIISDQIRTLTIDDLFGMDTCYLGSDEISLIRSIFFPEIKIQSVQKEV